MRSASAQPNWSIARIAIRCAVCGRRPKRRSCARTASANSPPPGTTSSGWRAPASAIAAHSARSAPSPRLAREPAADLDDGQHDARSGRPRARRAPPRAPRRARAALHGISSHGPAEALRHRAGEERARARAARPAARSATRVPTCRAAASIWRTCSAWRWAAIASTSAGLELLGVGADEPRDALARALDARRAPVRRRARVGLGRQVPEDQVHVGADREQLRRRPGTSARARGRAERSPRGWCAARPCRRARPPAAGRGRCARRRPTRPAAIGITSAVVLPTSSISASGCSAPTASALATQLAAATSSGRARASARLTSSPAVVRASSRPRARPRPRRARSATPSRLVRNASESSAVIVSATSSAGSPAELGDDVAQRRPSARSRSRQTSNGRETVRTRVAVAPHRLRVGAADVEADHAAHPRRFPVMRVIPVIDLKGGVAVHAVRGERERYRPLRSRIADGSDPVRADARGARRASASTSSTSPTSTRSRAARAARASSPRWRGRRA